jgi:hypothetical protein
MSFRRLALVCALTLADYLLWNWSLSGNHSVLALVSGLTLPFLLVASTVLFALSLLRVISGSVRRSPHQAAWHQASWHQAGMWQAGQQQGSQQQATSPGSGTGQRHRLRARGPGTAAGLLRRRGRSAARAPSPERPAASVPSDSPSPVSSTRQPGSSARQRAA